jgi:HrpA-like RNA helicase
VSLKPWSKSKKFTQISAQVARLPASQPEVKREFYDLLDQSNVILLSGETGSGKTTQVPKLLWEYLDYSDTVICTQPTTLTAATVATRVAEEMDVKLGQHVGFRFKDSHKAPGGDIVGFPIMVYMTEGTFLNDIRKNPMALANYGAVIIDEAHGRSINIDMLLFYIREVLKMGDIRTKFIIMSATLEKEVFMDYFKEFDMKYINITGFAYPVQSKSLVKSIFHGLKANFEIKKATEDMIKILLLEIFKEKDSESTKTKSIPEDVLIFLPSKKWIDQMQSSLTSFLEYKGVKNFVILNLSADVPIDERDIRVNPKPGYTKIILSTNIAETGVTVNGLKWVIDSGLAFKKGYSLVTRESRMDMGFISQAEAKQRQGRAGRMQPGVCYRLFTNEEFQKEMSPFREPEILRENLDHMLLDLFVQFKDQSDSYQMVLDANKLLVTPIPYDGLAATLQYFRKIGVIEDKRNSTDDIVERGRVSKLGECYQAMLTLELPLINFFMTALAYEIEPEIIADLIAILEIKPIHSEWFKAPKEGLPKEFKDKYMNDYGDIIGLYQIYLDYKSGLLPEKYKQYLNLTLFNQVKDKSEGLSDSPVTGGWCPLLIKPKYAIKQNTYLNLVSAIRQSYEATSTITVSELDTNRMQTNLLDLTKEPKKLEIIYLTSIVNLIFGEKKDRTFNNFVKI